MKARVDFHLAFSPNAGIQLMNKKMKLVPRVVGGYTHSSVNYRELGDWRGAQRKLEMRWLTTKLRQKRFGKCRNGNSISDLIAFILPANNFIE